MTGIEKNQGVDSDGRTFGYDHGRNNFIVWAIENNRIVVLKVEHDTEEQAHGSLKATERDAKRIAAQENRLPNSQLRKSILNRQ